MLCNKYIFFFFFFFFVSVSVLHLSHGQQTYINNKQLNCSNNLPFTNGFFCNGPQKSCDSYLTFRSSPPYDSPADIAYLLGSDPLKIAQINNISDVDKIPINTLIIVPVNCSCASDFYQHNTSYTLKKTSEVYFTVANDTYQALTTCQALMTENPYDKLHLRPGMKLTVPLRCACPTINQAANGVRFLLTHLVAKGETISSIAENWGVDEQSIRDANQLSDGFIFFFTPLLVPLKSVPTKINSSVSPPPAAQPPPLIVPSDRTRSSNKGVFVGIGVGGAAIILVVLAGFLFWFLRSRRTHRGKPIPQPQLKKSDDYTAMIIPAGKKPGIVSSDGVRCVVESLILYSFEELQRATGFFSEGNRIRGSVYSGLINGDNAAIKRMKGEDVSKEINILKQINHSNVIRLSGFCVHQGNTYLVYEFADNGSIGDWLHDDKKQHLNPLEWKQRVQIAYDVADGLNYLHNYVNPPCIHKDLKSSNVLLDGNLRAKIANFGLARRVDDDDDDGEGGLQMTRHVVGTQGYMAPEYIENGVVTPKLDVFAFGVVMLELLSGKEAAVGEISLSVLINQVIQGENVREKLRGFIDPSLREEYPLDLAFSMAQLANKCVAHDLNSRPTTSEVIASLSKILSSSLDWDPSIELRSARSLSH